MGWIQKEITISAKKRGFCLITNEILRQIPEIEKCKAGLLHLFIKHTSASLTINENADPTVRADLEEHFKRSVPDGAPYYLHTMEGDDDMSAHIKSTTIGNSLSIPIKDGRLELGAWQGIYICEHREKPHSRRIFISINGENI
ncbi:MAG: secondary thiamine-phosphate synthase [Candidatus Marinimicrobia bacterium]|nr:secondary thiamine-phosphate synthase [Candidatus Neomarinimicrobiota bacterium]